jgi:hypothetical protein
MTTAKVGPLKSYRPAGLIMQGKVGGKRLQFAHAGEIRDFKRLGLL